MIQEAMKAVADDLKAMLRRQRGDSRDRVILCKPGDPAGAATGEGEDKICLVLTQITEEKNVASSAPPRQSPEASARLSMPVSLNLHVLFAAQYARYEVGIGMIAYLHAKPLFTRAFN